MFLFYFQPDCPANISAIYANDMGKPIRRIRRAIDRRENAVYALGGDVTGPMGEALIPFADIGTQNYTGRRMAADNPFSEVTMDMCVRRRH
jgi:nitrous oxide reductase accessory protein NosL